MVIRQLKGLVTKFPWVGMYRTDLQLPKCLPCILGGKDTYSVSSEWPACLLDTASHKPHVGVWAGLSPAASVLENCVSNQTAR